jgi:hypothetical protein
MCTFLNLFEEQQQFSKSAASIYVDVQLSVLLLCGKCNCCSELDGTSKHLFLIQENYALLWLVLLSNST